jgi:putative transposase
MARRPRVEYEGAVYHVYNRVASGERVFDDESEARAFTDSIREVKERDGWTLFAWALLPNHFHLALRTSVVPLSRSMRSLQGRFSRDFNRRRGRTGGLWQSRYQAKLVDEQRYLSQVVLYVHLNPLRARLVDDPADFSWCGHRELIRRPRRPLVDVDDLLLCFDERRRSARRLYIGGLQAAMDEMRRETGRRLVKGLKNLSWDDRDLEGGGGTIAGRAGSTVSERNRPRLEGADFVTHCCEILGIDPERVGGRARNREMARVRQLIAALGVERWRQRCVDLAAGMNKNPDVVSWWASRTRRRGAKDVDFESSIDDLDAALAERLSR